LIQLLGIDRTAIQNFEALMALTNLAAMSDSVRYCKLLSGLCTGEVQTADRINTDLIWFL